MTQRKKKKFYFLPGLPFSSQSPEETTINSLVWTFQMLYKYICNFVHYNILKIYNVGDFLAGLVAETPSLPMQEAGVGSLVRELDSTRHK